MNKCPICKNECNKKYYLGSSKDFYFYCPKDMVAFGGEESQQKASLIQDAANASVSEHDENSPLFKR